MAGKKQQTFAKLTRERAVKEKRERKAEKKLVAAEERARLREMTPAPVTIHSPVGSVVEQLRNYAREVEVDLIVMTTHARGPFRHFRHHPPLCYARIAGGAIEGGHRGRIMRRGPPRLGLPLGRELDPDVARRVLGRRVRPPREYGRRALGHAGGAAAGARDRVGQARGGLRRVAHAVGTDQPLPAVRSTGNGDSHRGARVPPNWSARRDLDRRLELR